MKKFIAMITSICLCAVAFLSTPALVSAVGNDEPAFIVEEVSGYAGDEVTVNISVKNNPGICAAKVTISYDGNTLELKKAENGGFYSKWCSRNLDFYRQRKCRFGKISDYTDL